MNGRILPAVAFLLAIGVFFAYVNPTWKGSIADTKAAILADDQALAAASTYAAQQVELTSEQNAIDPANLAQLATFLPDGVDNVGLILDLNTLAARSGIALSNIDVVGGGSGSSAASAAKQSDGNISVTQKSPVDSVDLSLSAVGTYTAFQAFLGGIEKSARILDVQDLSVKGSETGVYTYKMVVRLYWLR